jgi:hypothetical protein
MSDRDLSLSLMITDIASDREKFYRSWGMFEYQMVERLAGLGDVVTLNALIARKPLSTHYSKSLAKAVAPKDMQGARFPTASSRPQWPMG